MIFLSPFIGIIIDTFANRKWPLVIGLVAQMMATGLTASSTNSKSRSVQACKPAYMHNKAMPPIEQFSNLVCSLHPMSQSRLPRRRGIPLLDRVFRYNSRYGGICPCGKGNGDSGSDCYVWRLPRSRGVRRLDFIGRLLADLVSRHRDDYPRSDYAPDND